MIIQDILTIAAEGGELLVNNSPFVCSSKLTLTLEGGDQVYWIFSEDERLLSVNPVADEVIAFSPVEEEITGDDEAMVYHGKEYEFSYEDRGAVTDVGDGAVFDEGEQISFRDYEAEDGEIFRKVTAVVSGEEMEFFGRMTLDDDIINV